MIICEFDQLYTITNVQMFQVDRLIEGTEMLNCLHGYLIACPASQALISVIYIIESIIL